MSINMLQLIQDLSEYEGAAMETSVALAVECDGDQHLVVGDDTPEHSLVAYAIVPAGADHQQIVRIANTLRAEIGEAEAADNA